MFGRSFILLLALAAAVGIPFVTSRTSNMRHEAANWWLSGETEVQPQAEEVAAEEPVKIPSALDTLPALRPEGLPISDLAEIFNFDVTMPWILGRWPRVNTRLAELDLQGYRVPLVSGTREDDLAGSLTYYFNKKQQVERITFRGTTGDARKLVHLLATRHRFVRQMHDNPGLFLYQVKWNGKAWSELHIRPTHVVSATSPYARFEVALDMRRPHWLNRPGPFRSRRSEPDPQPAPRYREASARSSRSSQTFTVDVWRWLTERTPATRPEPAATIEPAVVEAPTATETGPPGGEPSSPATTAVSPSPPQAVAPAP